MKMRGAKVSKLDPACSANSGSRLMEMLLIKHQSRLSEGCFRKLATTAPRRLRPCAIYLGSSRLSGRIFSAFGYEPGGQSTVCAANTHQQETGALSQVQ